MSLHNLGKNHLAAADKTQIKALMTQIEQILQGKVTDLAADDRQKYGSINEQNKLLVNKVLDYRDTHPQHASPDVDWAEFQADYDSRKFWENIATRLTSITRLVESTKILHDYDNYQDALSDYAYTQYRAGRDVAGASDKEAALKQFFPRTPQDKTTTTE